MYRSNDSVLLAEMPTAPSPAAARQPSRGYTVGRSEAARPLMSVAAFRAGRRSRALQLSWVGLVRVAR